MSAKNLDKKGRLRNKVIAFRMSSEENELLDRKVLLSGHTKQDYIISCILNKEIVVYGNPYVFRSLHDELIKIIEIHGVNIADEDDEDVIEWALKMVLAMRKARKTEISPY